MKRISKEGAKTKYGVLVGGVNAQYKYFLREDGCVVDSDGDLRYIPPYEKSMFVAEVSATAVNGKEFSYRTYSRLIEYAKQDAINHLPIAKLIPNCPIGELHISLMVTQDDEYVDSDECFAEWNGKEIIFDAEKM